MEARRVSEGKALLPPQGQGRAAFWLAELVRSESLGVILVLLLGLGLRLWALGRSSLWFDEVGVAEAITAPDLGGMLAVMKTHVMAMPLDYLVGWVSARVCSSDACLRIPSALWGTLSLLAAYLLLRRLTQPRAALVGMLLLALTPIHLYYSQELRFYAALVFFYLLGTLLLWDALARPSLARWAAAALVVGIGGYFHIYVLLCYTNGFFWLMLEERGLFPRRDRDSRLTRRLDWKKWAGLAGSGLGALVIVLPGVMALAPHQTYLGEFDPILIIFSLVSGLGGYPNYPGEPGLGLAWFGLFVTFGLLGFYRVLRSRRRAWIAWSLSTLLQIAVLLVLDALWRYWVNPRQFLQFLPWVCFLAAVGLAAPWSAKAPAVVEDQPADDITEPAGGNTQAASASQRAAPDHRMDWVLGGMVALVLLASLPALSGYYSQKKSLGREISAALEQTWQPGESVLVVPPEYPVLYQYYLRRAGREDIASACLIADWIELESIPAPNGPSLIVAGPGLTEEQMQGLRKAGYERVEVDGEVAGLQTLWEKR